MATGALLLTAGTTIYSASQQTKARREARKAQRIEQRKAEAINLAERRSAVADRLRKQAQAIAAGTASGVSGTSSVVQAELSSLGGQLGANIGFATQVQQLESARIGALNKIQEYQSNIELAQSVGQLGQAVFKKN